MKKFSIHDIWINIILMLIAAIMIIPFYNVVLLSFSTPAAVAKQKVYLIPTVFDTAAYERIFHRSKIVKAFGVSVLITVLGTIVNMFVSVSGAYVLSKPKKVPGAKFIMKAVIFTMLFNGGLIPYYLNIKGLNLFNNLLVMILPMAVQTFYLIILVNYFKTVPKSLEESAKIDGANDIQILFKIILPISVPTLAAITLFYAVDRWNEWWHAYLFINKSSLYPMQLFLKQILTDAQRLASNSLAASMVKKEVTPEGIKMATIVVTMIPIMLVYPWLQKYFSTGIMLGAVKE